MKWFNAYYHLLESLINFDKRKRTQLTWNTSFWLSCDIVGESRTSIYSQLFFSCFFVLSKFGTRVISKFWMRTSSLPQRIEWELWIGPSSTSMIPPAVRKPHSNHWKIHILRLWSGLHTLRPWAEICSCYRKDFRGSLWGASGTFVWRYTMMMSFKIHKVPTFLLAH